MHVSVVSMSFLIRAYDTGIRKLMLIRNLHTIRPVRRGKRVRSIHNSKFKDQPGSCPAEKTWRRQRSRDLAEKAMDAPAKTKVSCFLILSIHLINYQLHMNQQESCTVAYLRAARTYAFIHGLIRRLLVHGSVLASSQS